MPERNHNNSATIVVFERDLRLSDQEAVCAAARAGDILPVFILDAQLEAALGAAQKWWLNHSLSALDASLAEHGGSLVLRRGSDRAEALRRLVQETGIQTICWTRRFGVFGRDEDDELAGKLAAHGAKVQLHAGQLLHDPAGIRTGGGTPFRVYTPFWRALTAQPDAGAPLAAPARMAFVGGIASDRLADWQLTPKNPDWSGGMAAEWQPGEAGAHERLSRFLDCAIDGYGENRNRPDYTSTSKLSPHLAFGEISPRQVLSAAAKRKTAGNSTDCDVFHKEVVWREFAYHLLAQQPELATRNFNPAFDTFPWRDNDALFAAWTRGRTGYPIVDAGMRELWQTGWMHNRVRMIVASFLCKHLLIDWRRGERWFWDTLVDADPANNAASWQWVAGSGADAAPYFRVFNPILQGEKFDPDGAYVRKYVPELAGLPNAFLHKPWEAPVQLRKAAGLVLGVQYPAPIIDHAEGRAGALAAYQALKEQT